MKNILVPVDFSKDSINALDHAISIANREKANIRIIHVRKNKNYDTPFIIKGGDKEYGKTVNDFCSDLVTKYKPKYKGHGYFDFIIRIGKIYNVIAEQAEIDQAYLIVMGTHGVSGFEEHWVGSNAYKVVCKAPCPVLTIRSGYKKKKINRIVLPIDARSETRMKVPYIADMASVLKAEVNVVSVRTTERSDIVKRLNNYVTQTVDFLEKRGIKVTKGDLKGNNIAEITYTYAVHQDAGLIAIVSNERGAPLSIPISSTAQHMVNHSPVPVLSIHPDFVK